MVSDMARSGAISPAFAVSADTVLVAVPDGELLTYVRRRGAAPYSGRWELPGGTVQPSEDLAAAARRSLAQAVGSERRVAHLEQIGAYGSPRRDPRGAVLSVAYLALVRPDAVPASDESDGRWVPVADLLARTRTVAFDHAAILRDGLAQLRSAMQSSTLAAALCERDFTVGELRRVYETVWGAELDARNFHRKVTGTPGLLVATRKVTTRHGGRPARLYRTGSVSLLDPPITRP